MSRAQKVGIQADSSLILIYSEGLPTDWWAAGPKIKRWRSGQVFWPQGKSKTQKAESRNSVIRDVGKGTWRNAKSYLSRVGAYWPFPKWESKGQNFIGSKSRIVNNAKMLSFIPWRTENFKTLITSVKAEVKQGLQVRQDIWEPRWRKLIKIETQEINRADWMPRSCSEKASTHKFWYVYFKISISLLHWQT